MQGIEPWDLSRNPDNLNWDNAERSAPFYIVMAEDIINSLDWLDRCEATHRERRNAMHWK